MAITKKPLPPRSPESKTVDGNPLKNDSLQFLLTEYNNLTELWKHTDSRFESSLHINLTANALVVSALAIFSQRVIDLKLFLLITVFVALILALMGKILSNRLLMTAFNKAEYIYAKDLIRRFFANQSPTIIPHLYFLPEEAPEGTNQESPRFKQLRGPGLTLWVIHLWVSALLGFALSTTMWLIIPSTPIAMVILPGIIMVIIFFVYLTYTMIQKIRIFRLENPGHKYNT